MDSEDTTIDFEKSVGPWLGKTMKIMDYYLQEALQREGLDLSKEQMIVLKKLHDKDGLHQNELAFLTLRNKSSLTRLLVKMERKDYIRREQHADDRRINQVFLTDLGRSVFKDTRPVIKTLMTIMEKDLSAEEKDGLINILRKIQYNFTSKETSL
ncbi:MarR family transcriptional regulator [Flavobacteriaceae bacterium 3-367]|uniref:MarR family winged helix-turn-helix transcriptional regulator n=1 Tax=Eudoraea algarum TaxID=3417568 RepID=UPI003276FF6B